MVDTRQREKVKSLGEKLVFVEKDIKTIRKAFDDAESSDKDLEIFTNKAVQRFLKEFENDLLEGKSEEEAVKDFLDKINEEIKCSLAQKRDATVLAFQELKKNIQSYKIQSPNMPSSQELLQLTDQRLPEDQYKWYRDVNYYVTNNYICAALAGVAIVGTPCLLFGAGLGT